MDSKGYLKNYGWEEGEAFKKGGLKKPILVKHKKDKKGLGCAPHQDDSEAWWERLFDGQLKGLDIKSNGGNGITFEQKEVVATGMSKESSPLYRWFVRGEGLKGTIRTCETRQVITVVDVGLKRRREGEEISARDVEKVSKKVKKDKKYMIDGKKDKKRENKEKRDKKREKKEKKDKKREKKNKKEKKEKKDKKRKRDKKEKKE